MDRALTMSRAPRPPASGWPPTSGRCAAVRRASATAIELDDTADIISYEDAFGSSYWLASADGCAVTTYARGKLGIEPAPTAQ